MNNANKISTITYFDEKNKRNKVIELEHQHKGMRPHVHHGYIHNENDSKKGASKLTPKGVIQWQMKAI